MRHRCNYAHDRVISGPDDFENAHKALALYEDLSYPVNDRIRWDDMPHMEGEGLKEHEEIAQWLRVKDTFTFEKGYSLWGEHGISPEDIRQGDVGDCWFIAAASAMAERSERLERVFINQDDQHTGGIDMKGIYGLQFYALLMPVTITIDDYLPFENDAGKTIYAGVGRDKSVWGPLMEKAFAKFHGSYEAIASGTPEKALNTLAGSPNIDFMHAEITVDDLWEKLVRHGEQAYAMITTGVFHENPKHNLSGNMAYTQLSTVELSNGQRLVKVRNPTGSELYTGPYSDSSSKWTDTLKEEAGFTQANDGIFFVPIEVYKSEFGVTYINYDTYNMCRTDFLKLNDTHDKKGNG